MLVKEYKNYKYGIIDTIEAHSIPHGAASRSLNWQTRGDKIELTRGRALLGTENSGTGKITGLHVALQADATEVLYASYLRKIKYYDSADLGNTLDWIEIGTNTLPVAASGEDVSFSNYNSLAGAQVWINTPNGSLYKIMTANPGSITDMYDAAKNFKGYIRIKQNRTFLWNRGASGSGTQQDPTGIYLSYIDAGAYTTVSAEVLASCATGTLAFKAGGATRTCFGVKITITASGEVFTDNYNGILTGSLGNTGTINYTSGAFTTTGTGAGTADYQWENSNVTGISDYTESGTRTAGQGATLRQDDGGGKAMTIQSYQDVEYCLHEKKTWALTLTADDTNATNLIFREKVGIPNWRAAVPTGDGIFYIDDTDKSKPMLRLLTLSENSSVVIPVPISLNLDLESYRFDMAWALEWNEYIIFGCRTSGSTVNNRIILYHKIWKSLDYLDYYASCAAVFNGGLVIGDSLSNNVYQIFSGLDDDGSIITNYWEGALSDIETDGLKRTKRFIVEGEIGPDQTIQVYISYDSGSYAPLGTIEGSGTYVDKSQAVNVGAVTVGRTEVGGGGSSGAIPAYHYLREFRIDSGKFERCKIKYEALGLGYASVSTERYKDIRSKGNKVAERYRTSS